MTCECSGKHVPKPLVTFTVKTKDGEVELCPTSYYNLKSLLDKWTDLGSWPPGSVRKHYSAYIQQLAKKTGYLTD